jgi:galactofuranosylgalactofuranosylrhamnosyl-N-acetylglucosaminyl-diphospho-decaprenol beta-1,5/1,6-galactofuranosyltransferase
MLRHSLRVHARLYREFPALAEQYRAHLGDLTSPESWSRAFGEGTPVR